MRTYIRTLLDNIFRNNLFINISSWIVNFYCNLVSKNTNNLKFHSNMSIKDMEEKKTLFFQSVTGDKIDCK